MSKRKLLLADDSITIQKVVNLTFADEGIEVISVGDGDSAMRKFDDFIPDLVMADVNMPGLNGYEVCRIIKVTEETRHIPVILLVGSFEPFDEAEARDAGADDFLTKPFQSIRQLVNKVTDLLNQSEKNATDAAYMENPPPSVVDSFAETLELKEEGLAQESGEAEAGASNDFELRRSISNNFEDRPSEISSEFGDAGMDDEMIETSPASDYVSDSDSAYQRETTIDYAKTQPLNSEDLKGFEMVSGENAEARRSSEAYEIREPLTSERGASDERSEPASFDEEARKLNQSEDYGDLESYPELQNEETTNVEAANEDTAATDEDAENLSETEPQIDYYLPNEPEFEKEITDAETLAPEVSYEPEAPREADFSQTSEDESGAADEESAETEQKAEAEETAKTDETIEAAETPSAEPTAETAGFDQDVSEETPRISEEAQTASAAYFTEEPVTAETSEADESDKTDETAAEIEASEYSANYPQAEPETVTKPETEFEEVEPETEPEAETAEMRAESERDEQPEAEAEEPAGAEAESVEAQEINKDFEKTDESPMFASEAASPVDFDDADLLELPPLVEETGIRPQPKAEPIVPEVVAAVAAPTVADPESKITVTKTVAESEIALSFPPELIEAIAQKVADKISAKAMTDVLPQITELVMKKLAEQNQESKK